MNAKDLALALSTQENPPNWTNNLKQEAKAAGLVIVYGASDDLVEFEGTIEDEVGGYGGTTIHVDSEGVMPLFEFIDKDDIDALRNYFKREGGGLPIKAVFGEDGAWSFETDIPHEPFVIPREDDSDFRGVVFSLADVKKLPPNSAE